jgi:hypothetical protein
MCILLKFTEKDEQVRIREEGQETEKNDTNAYGSG